MGRPRLPSPSVVKKLRRNLVTYQQLMVNKRFHEILNEERARKWAWALKAGGGPYACPACGCEAYYTHQSRPEVRTCQSCKKQARLRPGTLFEGSKLPLAAWFRAIYWMIHHEKPLSIPLLQQRLGIPSYGTVWNIQKKIKEALEDPGEPEKYRSIFDAALAPTQVWRESLKRLGKEEMAVSK